MKFNFKKGENICLKEDPDQIAEISQIRKEKVIISTGRLYVFPKKEILKNWRRCK